MDAHRTIKTILEEHRPSDTAEHADRAFVERFISTHSVILGKENPAGHITGSALVLDPEDRLLLTFHRKLNRWLQLGGHSEPMECDPATTALREAREESGLSNVDFHPRFGRRLLDLDVHEIPARPKEDRHYHLDFRYVFYTPTPEDIKVSKESKVLRWVSLDECDGFGFDPALMRALSKLRGPLSQPEM